MWAWSFCVQEIAKAFSAANTRTIRGSRGSKLVHSQPEDGCMALSARNQLRGTIEGIQIGDIMAHVV